MVHGSPIPLTCLDGLIQDRKTHTLHVQLSFYLSRSQTEIHRISAHLHVSLVTPGGDRYQHLLAKDLRWELGLVRFSLLSVGCFDQIRLRCLSSLQHCTWAPANERKLGILLMDWCSIETRDTYSVIGSLYNIIIICIFIYACYVYVCIFMI